MGNSELTGNVQNQATINEHYKGTKKVAIYYYDTSNDIPIRVSSSNPLPTTATLSGDITASTEYTEDVASVADPIGGMTMARRRDTLVTNEVSADGDNIALNATNKGQLHVKQTDTVTVDGSGVTQPVSGTVTVTGVSTSAKQDTIIGHVDGIEGLLTTIDADTGNIATEVAGLLTDTELRATPVPVSGTVTATPTGTQNVDVTANTVGLATSAKQDTIIGHVDGLETLVGTTNSTLTTIDGRVDGLETLATSTNTKLDTVNTNLGTIDGRVDGLETLVTSTNTKLDTTNTNTGNAATSLAIMDDWDESDRAKVNPIVGQAGVAAAAGTVGATTQRVINGTGTTSNQTQVADSASSQAILAANTSRIRATIINDSTQILYLRESSSAATTSVYTYKLQPDMGVVIDDYNGALTGIWAANASGNAIVSEVVA